MSRLSRLTTQELADRLALAETDPAAYATLRIAEIQETIDGVEGGPGPILPRAPVHEGNVSMFTHLTDLKNDYGHPTRRTALIDFDIARMTSVLNVRGAR